MTNILKIQIKTWITLWSMLKILRIFLTRASKMDEISSQNIWKNIGPLLAKYDIADQFLSITPF